MPDAVVTLVADMQFVAETGSGHTVVMDAPKSVGGHAAAPSPMEMLLVGLGGCTGMDVISILRKKRQTVSGFSVEVHGEKAEEHPMRYTKINVVYRVRGRGVTEAAVKRAADLSMKKYCSVAATLGGNAEITYEWVIEDDADLSQEG